MRFPGFTAEAALVKTDEPYRLIGDKADRGGGQAVIPQTLRCWHYHPWGCLCCDMPLGPCKWIPQGECTYVGSHFTCCY